MQTTTATAVPTVLEVNTKMTLQQTNIARIKELLAEFMAGRPEGYLAGVADNIKGSILGGLIPGGEAVTCKEEFMSLMGKMEEFMDVTKFEPSNFFAVGDDVLFMVDWQFTWKPTGKVCETRGLVRKVLKDNMICEKYHMVDTTEVTGEKAPHDHSTVERVQALLAEFQAGRPEGYMLGVADSVKASMLGGLIPKADAISNKAEFQEVMNVFGEYMDVQKFEPKNFRALPNGDMMMQVDWQFVWKATGKTVETTAIVRKVLCDGCITEKYHMIDCDAVLGESPREVIGGM